jgi:Fic family protein
MHWLITAQPAANTPVCGEYGLYSPQDVRQIRYIHEQADWPNFAWDDAALAAALADIRHKQGRILGRMESLGFDLRSEASLRTLTSDVVKSSAIEGEKLDPQDVRSSIARKLGLDIAAMRPPRREVEGIVEIMLDATRNHDRPLTTQRLFAWHTLLFPGAPIVGRFTVGAWRTPDAGAMQVVSGPLGHERVHFEAPGAERLDHEMREFLAWFEPPSSIDPVIRAGIAHFWFVTIHPFEDGNGRIARAIADMALARADQSKDRFYSMSSQIELERSEYYRQLERQQKGGLDITPWLSWFLACLGRAIDAAEDSLAAILHKARLWERINRAPVNDRQRTVINRMLDNFQGFLTSSKYAKLAKCSTDTALRDIQELLERNILIRNPGGGRSTSYRLGEPDSIFP